MTSRSRTPPVDRWPWRGIWPKQQTRTPDVRIWLTREPTASQPEQCQFVATFPNFTEAIEAAQAAIYAVQQLRADAP